MRRTYLQAKIFCLLKLFLAMDQLVLILLQLSLGLGQLTLDLCKSKVVTM